MLISMDTPSLALAKKKKKTFCPSLGSDRCRPHFITMLHAHKYLLLTLKYLQNKNHINGLPFGTYMHH